MKYFASLILFLTLLPSSLSAKTVTYNKSRSIEVIGDVNTTVIPLAEKLVKLSDESKKPVDVLINSFGGSVISGQMLTQAMDQVRARGVKLRCFVGVAAASMAFQIFTHCDERYTLKNTRLLFHPPYYSQAEGLNTRVLAAMLYDLTKDEEVLLSELRQTIGINSIEAEEWFMTNYINERWFRAEDLFFESPTKWFEVVEDIKNCPNLYRMRFGTETADIANSLIGR